VYKNVLVCTKGTNFFEISKNLGRYGSENNFAHQNNYVGNSSIMSNAKNLDILAINLNILHNYFERGIQRLAFS